MSKENECSCCKNTANYFCENAYYCFECVKEHYEFDEVVCWECGAIIDERYLSTDTQILCWSCFEEKYRCD